MENINDDFSEGYSNRFVSYFDLLGFSELVNTKEWFDVYSHYTKAVKQFNQEYGFTPQLEKIWFSDTFVLYSSEDNVQSFTSIEAMSRAFVYFLILGDIPVRGAMSYGKFYADKEKNAFFGPAIIEAYNYGENQDWVGFVLTPSTIKQMATIGLPADKRLNYAYWDIPLKSLEHQQQTRLPAYIIGGHLIQNGRNLCLDKLRTIRHTLQNSGNSKLVTKYENTIRFIEENTRN